MIDAQGNIRRSYQNDWLARHRNRERLAMKNRWLVFQTCRRCGIEYEVESFSLQVEGKTLKIKRFLFCYDGEVVTWEPFDARLRFESEGREEKCHATRWLVKKLANHFKVMEK